MTADQPMGFSVDRGYLEVIAGPDAGRRVEIAPMANVGRDDRWQLNISEGDPGVHRNPPHFRVMKGPAGFMLLNFYPDETIINGAPVGPQTPLADGDTIEIGLATKIRFIQQGNTGFVRPPQ